ncbi:MAG: hypothetical protein GOV01_01370 [Candidatus Altiarchaeota archaeon]|nr:hypothetical protein [Candidatus Altiarchaeota archaeon]
MRDPNKTDMSVLGFVNPNGQLKVRTFYTKPRELFRRGFGFDGSSVGYAPIENSDLTARPLHPPKLVSFNGSSEGFNFGLCDVWQNGTKLPLYGRTILEQVLSKHKIRVDMGYESEFYVLDKHRTGNYMAPAPHDSLKSEKTELLNFLNRIGIPAYLEHHEVGKGQHELSIDKGTLPIKADEFFFYKFLVSQFFKAHGHPITFMPKPFFGEAGNGNHLHLSVWQDGQNLFQGNGKISETGTHFIAGVLQHAEEISLVLNSTVNSYKRLVPHHEAPVYVAWGYANRSALIRVPGHNEKINRFEVRSVDNLINIYLALAAIIDAGMKGINEAITPPNPVDFNLYNMTNNQLEKHGIKTLPRNLGESIQMARKGTILKNLMGNHFKQFIKQKQDEWNEYVTYLNQNSIDEATIKVTDWETQKYQNL